MDLLETHTQEILKRCERVFVRELDSADDVSSQIPIVKWECCDRAPGAFALYLLSFCGLHRKTRIFLEEMITQWLVPSANLHIISFKSLIFNTPRYQHPLSFVEIVVPVPDQKTLEIIRSQLPVFIEEIKRGISSVDLASHILEMKRNALSSKTSSVYEGIFVLMRRHPKLFSHDIFREMQYFLLHCTDEFRKIRDARLLCRIICSHYLLQKNIEQEVKTAPHLRHISLKFLSAKLCYPFGVKRVVGLTIALNQLGDYESFELPHIVAAIQRFVPDAYARTDSFFSHLNAENQVRIIYLELEKEQGNPYTINELKLMNQELSAELQRHIEYLSPSLFIPPTEEDLVRNIITLSAELKHAKDQPQAVISFEEQRSDILKFKVALLRVVKPESGSPSIQELSKRLPTNTRFILQKAAIVGNLRGKYQKEADIFTLEIDGRLFLRLNHSVDLMRARQSVVKALEKMVGPFNDCSVSLLPKIHKKEPMQVAAPHLQTLRLHLPRAAQSLDPRAAADRTSGIVIRMLYEGLCRVNTKGEIEPAIARDISISEDKKKYIFTLKETYWSNGSPLTAYDFEYAWKKILEPSFNSPYSFLFFSVKNAEAAKRGDVAVDQVGIEVLGDYTLAVTLEYPAPFFLDLMASWLFSPLCREIDQKHPGWAYHSSATHVCNGPFKVDVWKFSDTLQLAKNPFYWDTASVKLDQLQITVIEDEKKALDLFYKGELDWVGDPLSKIPPQELHSLNRSGLLHVDPQNYGLFWVQLNMLKHPLNNAKIRKALAYAINRKELVKKTIDSDVETPAFGFSALKEAAFPPTFKDGDQELALRLFEEGLQELGMSRQDLPPIVITHSEIEEQIAISYALAEQWKNLFGIEVKFQKVLWNAYFDTLARNDFMVGGLVWYSRYNDPIYFYDLFVSRPYAVQVSTWKNTAYENIIHEAKHTNNKEKRIKLLQEAEAFLLDAMPVIPLFYQHFRYIKNPNLKGFITSNLNQIDFCTAKIIKEGT